MPQDLHYYDVLNVAPDADADAIREAFQAAALTSHPDLAPGADPAAWADIAQAHRVLSDPKLRAKYDAEGREAVEWPYPWTREAAAKWKETHGEVLFKSYRTSLRPGAAREWLAFRKPEEREVSRWQKMQAERKGAEAMAYLFQQALLHPSDKNGVLKRLPLAPGDFFMQIRGLLGESDEDFRSL